MTPMVENSSSSLENQFLEKVCSQKMPLTIFLINGVKLQGTITFNDTQTVMLSREGHAQLVYKHAISTIMPTQSLEINFD